MQNILWEPTSYHYKESNLAKFISFINSNYNQDIKNYDELYDWSIDNISFFWESVSLFCDIKFF